MLALFVMIEWTLAWHVSWKTLGVMKDFGDCHCFVLCMQMCARPQIIMDPCMCLLQMVHSVLRVKSASIEAELMDTASPSVSPSMRESASSLSESNLNTYSMVYYEIIKFPGRRDMFGSTWCWFPKLLVSLLSIGNASDIIWCWVNWKFDGCIRFFIAHSSLTKFEFASWNVDTCGSSRLFYMFFATLQLLRKHDIWQNVVKPQDMFLCEQLWDSQAISGNSFCQFRFCFCFQPCVGHAPALWISAVDGFRVILEACWIYITSLSSMGTTSQRAVSSCCDALP